MTITSRANRRGVRVVHMGFGARPIDERKFAPNETAYRDQQGC
jgi:hypothetical protein